MMCEQVECSLTCVDTARQAVVIALPQDDDAIPNSYCHIIRIWRDKQRHAIPAPPLSTPSQRASPPLSELTHTCQGVNRMHKVAVRANHMMKLGRI